MNIKKVEILTKENHPNGLKIYGNSSKSKNYNNCKNFLIEKKYNEFKKLIKNKYWSYNNGLMVIDILKLDNIDQFKYILNFINVSNMEHIVYYCCVYGLKNIAIYLIEKYNYKNYDKYVKLSIEYNPYILNKYMDKIILNKDIFRLAALTHKNTNLLKRLKNLGCPYDEYVFSNAAENGNLESIKWLYLNNFPHNGMVIPFAIFGDKINILNWLYNNNFSCDIVQTYDFIEMSLNNEEIIPVLNWVWDKNIVDNKTILDTITNKLYYIKKNKSTDIAPRKIRRLKKWVSDQKIKLMY